MVSASKLDEVIRDSRIVIKKSRYAYLQMDHVPPGEHFLVARDDDEITVVSNEAAVQGLNSRGETKWFRLFEINVAAPFVAKGFLAAVTRCVADQDLNILIVSTYSKDYALVRDETYLEAARALRERGFPVREEE